MSVCQSLELHIAGAVLLKQTEVLTGMLILVEWGKVVVGLGSARLGTGVRN